MKTKILVIALFISTISFSQDHDFRYAESFPSTYQLSIESIASLSNGGYAILGRFFMEVTIGDTVLQNTAGGAFNHFIACFSAKHELLWIKHLNHEGLYEHLHSDKNDNIYLAGGFFGEYITFEDSLLYTKGWADVLVASYQSSGELNWFKHIKTLEASQINSAATDENGNTYIALNVGRSPDHNKCFLHLGDTAVYGENGFRAVFSLDPEGSTRYVYQLHNSENSYGSPTSLIVLNDLNELYYLENRLSFIVGDSIVHSPPSLRKLNGSGNLMWAKSIPFLFYNEIVVDNKDRLYLNASIYDTAFLCRDTLIREELGNPRLLFMLDPLQSDCWYNIIPSEFPYIKLLKDHRNNLYLAFNYRGRVELGDTSVHSYSTQGLLTKFTENGEYEWLVSSRGNGAAYVNSIAVDQNNDILMGGYFDRFIYFGDTTLNGIPGINYGFIASINTCQKPFSIGPDTSFKLSDTIILQATAGYQDYLWSNGSNQSSTLISGQIYGPGDHYIWADATDEYCIYSDTVKVSIIDDTGIEKFEENTFSIVPNPATNEICVIGETGQEPEELRIYSLDGRQILQVKYPGGRIYIEGFKSGCYIVSCTFEGYQYFTKFIKAPN